MRMKKIFTLIALMSCVIGVKAADIVLFSTDFKDTSKWPVGDITAESEKNGVYFNCANSITANGLEMTAGNATADRWISIPLTGINKSFKATFTVPSSNGHFKYSIVEGNSYKEKVEPATQVNRNSSGTAVVEYTMAGTGTEAVLYFYRDGSARNKIEMIEITTPDPSAVTTAELTSVTVQRAEISAANLATLKSDKSVTISDAIEGTPIVVFNTTVTVTDSEGATSEDKSEKVVATEDGGVYKATFKAADGVTYNISFSAVSRPEVLDITGRGSFEVRITKDTYLSQAYFTSTDTWASATINGEADDYFNMAGADRNVAIKVKGAKKFEVYANNPNGSEERTYRVAIGEGTPATQTLEGYAFQSTGILDVNADGSEAVLNILTDEVGIRLYKAIFYESEQYITGIETVKSQTINVNAPIYNLAGQKVDASYKGVVIKDGKKMIQK